MPMKRLYGDCRGSLLVIVMAASVICSIIAYGLLYFAVGLARESQALNERDQKRYAAEAALVWAQQRLWEDEAWSPPAGTNVPLNIPGVSTLTVTIPACGGPPCPSRQLIVTADN